LEKYDSDKPYPISTVSWGKGLSPHISENTQFLKDDTLYINALVEVVGH